MPGTAKKTSTHHLITARDKAIAQFLYLYQTANISHIQRRFYGHCSSHSACYQRIAILTSINYVKHLPPEEYDSGPGSQKDILLMGPTAREDVAYSLDLDPDKLLRNTRVQKKGPRAHEFAICDFRLSLELALPHLPYLKLLGWLPQPGQPCPVITVEDLNEVYNLIPDAVIGLRAPIGDYYYYHETDMGTTPKRLKRKLRGYLIHERSLKNKRPVLFQVPSEKRAQEIANWAEEAAKATNTNPNIFYIAVASQINEATILSAPIWQIVGTSEPQYLVSPPAIPKVSWQPADSLQ